LVHPDGTIEVVQSVLVERGDPGCAIGRLPAGLIRSRTRRCTHPVGSFFAEVAHLEAAAIAAFEQLRTELFVHGAPMQLVRRAERARRDEIRHARITAALARRYHGHPRAPRLQPRWSPRSLVEIAADNAVEGCIRETYGALVAHAQAIQARDPRLRRILHQIARDETQHAALSWDIARWAESRGSAAERRTVALRTAYALEPLRAELTRAYAEQVHTVTGLPRPDQARALYDGLRSALFGRPS
jgi:hypothetical protein